MGQLTVECQRNEPTHMGWCPPDISERWFINSMNTIVISMNTIVISMNTIVISAINHSYGSYKP